MIWRPWNVKTEHCAQTRCRVIRYVAVCTKRKLKQNIVLKQDGVFLLCLRMHLHWIVHLILRVLTSEEKTKISLLATATLFFTGDFWFLCGTLKQNIVLKQNDVAATLNSFKNRLPLWCHCHEWNQSCQTHNPHQTRRLCTPMLHSCYLAVMCSTYNHKVKDYNKSEHVLPNPGSVNQTGKEWTWATKSWIHK